MLLEKLDNIITGYGLICTTIFLPNENPKNYAVLDPLYEEYALFANNAPQYNVEHVRINIYTQKDYAKIKRDIEKLLREADVEITGREYGGYSRDSGKSQGYHLYCIDVCGYEYIGGI
ncbi:hypothetical protein AGMMS49975_24720 [Clostridia bacterium]|nr:hypothetical protein AGMMS49975_24720 [Clostridia bacterium]GHU74717.1 hypothetical protein FACS1894188_03840 [Clostridia bacterium]